MLHSGNWEQVPFPLVCIIFVPKIKMMYAYVAICHTLIVALQPNGDTYITNTTISSHLLLFHLL